MPKGSPRSFSTPATATRPCRRRAEDRVARGRRFGPSLFERPGGHYHGTAGAGVGRRRDRLQRGHLRGHAAPARGRAGALRRHGRGTRRSRISRGPSRFFPTPRAWCGSNRPTTRRCAAWTSAPWREACQARGVLSAIDNTFASPVNQRPLLLGVDLVMHSVTKYLNGHADVTAGMLAGSRRSHRSHLRDASKLGTVLDPAAAYALARGLKTLDVRWSVTTPSARRGAVARGGRARRHRAYPGLPRTPTTISRAADARLRRHGVRRPRQLRAGCPVLRPAG
jgi:hypothetical protein